jgi:flagellar motor protein MotB
MRLGFLLQKDFSTKICNKERKVGMKILGWILFLAAIALGLVFYNLRYLPLQDERTKVNNEILMWQTQVKDLEEKLNYTTTSQQPIFSQTFLWDDLFADPTSFTLTEPAQVILKEIITRLQQTAGEIIVAGHYDNSPVIPELKKMYPTDRELTFAKAMAVVNFLQSWGVKKERLVCIGYGSTRPIETNDTSEGRSKNRRVEIIVREPSSKTSNEVEVDTIVK